MDIGAEVKQYRVIEHIGRGGMADVWSAQDQRLRRMVAIKTIAVGLAQDVDPIALFEREAQTIARMEHPHILPIYDFGEYDNSLYIVMRYVTGGSLEDLLRGGPLSIEDTLRIGQAVAQALDYAHENNVIHLDLKPGNILLDSHRSPYLADFGLATVLDAQGRARNPGSGTLLYMAPEQLVSDVIDHRADLYSFCIMLFHMFTGQLPFSGTVPLAMRQLQREDGLPDPADINPDLPDALADILRHGTAQKPEQRPPTHMDIIKQIRDMMMPVSIEAGSSVAEMIAFGDAGPDLNSPQMTHLLHFEDDALLEAHDIYQRARQAWAGGQGRFLLGLTHFMLMSDYYLSADYYGLEIDESGYQMLLRGALEFDYQLTEWWEKQPGGDTDRRWVCLHTLRSGTTPARIRALHFLETLPDDEVNPTIPRLVGQALSIETDDDARIAALQVLRTRAAQLTPRYTFNNNVKASGSTSLSSVVTQLGIQLMPLSEWHDIVYSEDVDLMIAEAALDTSSERVATFAARTIGVIHSLLAVQHIAAAQRDKQPGALEALALIRDETTSLPDEVDRQARLYAWLMNTLRRLTDQPLEGIMRFVLVLLGGWIGMGEMIYTTYRSQALFTPQRWGNTLAIGLVFGLFVAVTVMVTDELSRRLERFWTWWLRLLVSGSLGFLMGMLTWTGYTWLYLQYVPQWDSMRLAGVAMAGAFVLAAILRLRAWQAIVFTTALMWLPVFALFQKFYMPRDFVATPVALIGLLIGAFAGWRASRLSALESSFELTRSPWLKILLGAAAGFGWTVLVWRIYIAIFQGFLTDNVLTWDGVLVIVLLSFLSGTIIVFIMKTLSRTAFITVATASFIALFLMTNPVFTTTPYQPPAYLAAPTFYYFGVPFAPPTTSDTAPLIYYPDAEADRHMIFTVTLPMLFVIALGAYARSLFGTLWTFIGSPRKPGERGGWLTGILAYGLVTSALIAVLSLFNLHTDPLWAIGWTLWGTGAFIALLATWRWARWGARSIMIAVLLLLAGGVLYDVRDSFTAAYAGNFPALLETATILLHPGSENILDAILNLILQTPVLFVALLSGFVFTVWGMSQRQLNMIAGLVIMGLLAVPFFVREPVTVQVSVPVIYAVWSVIVGFLTWTAYQRVGWSAIMLVTLLVIWFAVALLAPVQGNMTVLAMIHMGLLVYVLRPVYDTMERERFNLAALRLTATPTPSTPPETIPVAPPQPVTPVTDETIPDAEPEMPVVAEQIQELSSDVETAVPQVTEAKPETDPDRIDTQPVAGTQPARLKVDTSDLSRHRKSSKTEKADAESGENLMDTTPVRSSSPPRLKLDLTTEQVRNQQTEIDVQNQVTDSDKPSRPRLKLDLTTEQVRNQQTEMDVQNQVTDSDKSSRPRLKLDLMTEQVRDQEPDTLDTTEPDETPDQSSRPRIKLNTDLLTSSRSDDSGDADDTSDETED